MIRKMSLKPLVPLLLTILIFVAYVYREKAHNYFRFSEKVYSGPLDFSYEEKSKELGINHRTNLFISAAPLENYYAMAPAVDYVSAGDLDNDGYTDLIYTTANPKEPLKIYRSVKGKGFESVEDAWGFAGEKNKPGMVYATALFDFNNDGWLDVFVARDGCHDLYLNEKGRGFRSAGEETGVSKICNKRVTGISILDFNKDGYLDLYFTRLFGDNSMSGGDEAGVTYFIPRINKEAPGAGKNYLVENIGGKGMKIVENSGLDNGWLAWAAGITDVNDDGYPDIIVANDFSISRVYINNKDGTFTNRTKAALGLQYNSANMSLETGDFNNDGKVDFFVSNVSRSTYASNSYNYLYQKVGPEKYKNASLDVGVDRCGWAWGAKFIDPNLDGKLDIMVVNGFFNDGKNPYWYKWSVYGSLPQYLVNSPDVMPPTRGHSIEGDQPSCLFMQKEDGTFSDVANRSGIKDEQNGRGLAVLDLENNGSFDLAVANHNAEPSFYKQVHRNNDNNWIGINLRAKDKNIFAIGAKLIFKIGDTERAYEHYPTNGYSSQSHNAILMGLGKESKVSLHVVWPSGVEKNYEDLLINQYNLVKE